MNQDSRMRKRISLALRSRGEQYRGHRSGLPHANRHYVGPNELHRIVDRQSRCYRPTRTVDVDRYLAIGILRLEVEQLGDHDVRDHFIDIGTEKDDVLLQEPRVNIVVRLLPEKKNNDCRYKVSC